MVPEEIFRGKPMGRHESRKAVPSVWHFICPWKPTQEEEVQNCTLQLKGFMLIHTPMRKPILNLLVARLGLKRIYTMRHHFVGNFKKNIPSSNDYFSPRKLVLEQRTKIWLLRSSHHNLGDGVSDKKKLFSPYSRYILKNITEPKLLKLCPSLASRPPIWLG